MLTLPDELPPTDAERERIHRAESRCATSVLMASVVAAPVLGWLALRYAKTVLFLHPPTDVTPAAAVTSAKFLAVAGAVVLAAVLWRISLFLRPSQRTGLHAAAVVVVALVAGGAILEVPRVTWFFVEWARIRTPNPSHGKNALYWDQRNFPSAGPADGQPRVQFVGSSQINFGADLSTLSSVVPTARFEKNAMSGFWPPQFNYHRGRILERSPDVVVCSLSEFDFFRNERLPAERIGWAADLGATGELAALVPPSTVWDDRHRWAGLTAGSLSPLWRVRDHVRRAVLFHWENVSGPPKPEPKRPAPGSDPEADDGRIDDSLIDYVRKSVHCTPMTDANFASFQRFATELKHRGTRLVVYEGVYHPQAMAAVDPHLRVECRERLKELAAGTPGTERTAPGNTSTDRLFRYVEASAQPTCLGVDFADAVHMKPAAAKRWSEFVARDLRINELSDSAGRAIPDEEKSSER